MSKAHTLTDTELTEQLLVATKQRNQGRTRGTSDWGLWQGEVDRLEIELKRRVAKKSKPHRARRIERLVIWRLIKAAVAAGYSISLYDGGEWTVKKSTDRRVILGATMTTDEDQLRLRDAAGEYAGTVCLVYGNEGWTVISDYTDNAAMDALLTPIMDWAQALDEKTPATL